MKGGILYETLFLEHLLVLKYTPGLKPNSCIRSIAKETRKIVYVAPIYRANLQISSLKPKGFSRWMAIFPIDLLWGGGYTFVDRKYVNGSIMKASALHL